MPITQFILIVAILNFLLSFFVFINNRKNPINVAFSFSTALIGLWVFLNYLFQLTNSVFVLRAIYALGSFVMLSILWWVNYLKYQKVNKKFLAVTGIFLLVNIIFATLSLFTNKIVESVKDFYDYQTGCCFQYLSMYFVLLLLYFVYYFISEYRSADKKVQDQLRLILIGIVITIVIASVVGFVLPGLGITKFNVLDSPSSIFFVIFGVYSIIKYKFLDIKVITTEVFSAFLVIISLIDVVGSHDLYTLVSNIIIFLATLVFAVLLIRSVIKEIERREQMEELTKELRLATTKLESANIKLKKTANKLEAANKELKRLDDAKSEFLSIASHQLRTPLTIIKGYTSMMLEGSFGKLSKTVTENMNKIFISTERLISLVESLLNISRIESGRIEFTIEPVDLAATTEAIVNDFQQKAKAKKLNLEFHKDGVIPLVAADAQKVKEIISNIIDNSVKYTPKGEIVVTLHQESQSVVFACQDTGIGIDPEDLPRLFNKFVRGKGMMQVYTEGTGLGMYFARMVVENMGGRIWAESTGKDKGSKFSFSLPLADKAQAKKVS